jgi:PEP-CTERM/exosortase A-associated glycosyltransferase
MKILHILHHLSPEDGYAVRSNYIIENQSQHNKLCVLISPFDAESKKGRLVALDNVKYCHFQRNKVMSIRYVGRRYRDYRFKKNIAKIVKQDDIDIIHAHSPAYCPQQAYKISKARNIPLIYEVRGVWEDTNAALGGLKENSEQYNAIKTAENDIMKKADCIITISEGLKNDIILRDVDKDKIYVVPNGVDTDKFVPIKRDERLVVKHDLAESAVVGYIGSIRRLEGIEYLIKAMSNVLKTNNNAKLLLIGGGESEYIEELKTLSKDLGIAKKILFIDGVSHNEILNYYSLVDIMVIPRIRKRVTELVTPIKPLEAMAMEKLVICSDVGGLMELITDNETGILFEAEDAFELSNKINHFIENEDKRNKIGKTARKYVVAERNWKNITRKYNDIYGQMYRSNSNLHNL